MMNIINHQENGIIEIESLELRGPRTFSEVLKEADQASSLKEILDVAHELRLFKRHYSIVELRFAAEHLGKLAGELGRKDAQALKRALFM